MNERDRRRRGFRAIRTGYLTEAAPALLQVDGWVERDRTRTEEDGKRNGRIRKKKEKKKNEG